MELAELAVVITREVLKRLGRDARPPVRVLQARDAAVESALRPHLEEGLDLVFTGERTYGEEPCRYILPFLCCSDMVDLALGRASGLEAREVLGLLLEGKSVEVMEFEYTRFASRAPKALLELYASYRKTLKHFGLMDFTPGGTDPGTHAHASRKRLVTEKDVIAAAQNGATELAVPAGAIITALAADAAKLRRVNIRKRL